MILVLRTANFTMNLADIMLLSSSFKVLLFVAAPVHIISTALNRRWMSAMSRKSESCKQTHWQNYIIVFSMYIPVMFAVYELVLSQLRLYLLSEALSKQQATVLEIFEKQNESVLVY